MARPCGLSRPSGRYRYAGCGCLDGAKRAQPISSCCFVPQPRCPGAPAALDRAVDARQCGLYSVRTTLSTLEATEERQHARRQPARRTSHAGDLRPAAGRGWTDRLSQGRQPALIDRWHRSVPLPPSPPWGSRPAPPLGRSARPDPFGQPFVLFGYRYAVKTRKFMPSGLLAIVSLVVLAVMFLVMDWSGS